MAVTQQILWTFSIRPKLVLKELITVEVIQHMGAAKGDVREL